MNPNSEPGQQLRPNPDVLAQRMGDEMVLVHLRTDRIYELNRTGSRLWELIGLGGNRTGICRQMSLEYDVDEAQLAQEIDMLMASFLTEKLVLSQDE